MNDETEKLLRRIDGKLFSINVAVWFAAASLTLIAGAILGLIIGKVLV